NHEGEPQACKGGDDAPHDGCEDELADDGFVVLERFQVSRHRRAPSQFACPRGKPAKMRELVTGRSRDSLPTAKNLPQARLAAAKLARSAPRRFGRCSSAASFGQRACGARQLNVLVRPTLELVLRQGPTARALAD